MTFLAHHLDHGRAETAPNSLLGRIGRVEEPGLIRQHAPIGDALHHLARTGEDGNGRPRSQHLDYAPVYRLVAIVAVLAGRAVGIDALASPDAEFGQLPRQRRRIDAARAMELLIRVPEKAIVDVEPQSPQGVAAGQGFRRADRILGLAGDHHRPRLLPVAEDRAAGEDHLVVTMRDHHPTHARAPSAHQTAVRD